GRGDHGHLSADQIGHQCWQAVVLALQPMVLDRHVLPFDIAGFVEAFAKRSPITRRAIGRSGVKEADHRQCRLLPARGERPSGSEQGDKLAPPHSITSSARPSSVSGNVMPSALAVFMLMYSSTLVAC